MMLAALPRSAAGLYQLSGRFLKKQGAGLRAQIQSSAEVTMNIFLTSSFAEVVDLFVRFTGGECRGRTVTLIPTASLAEEVNSYLVAAREAFVEAGLVIDELEVSTATQDEIVSKLERGDYIYVSGGNTFFLLKRTGADRLIAEQVRAGKCYIGESAGSAILAPSIDYIRALDDVTAAPDLESYTALGLVDFYPLPHYRNAPFDEAVEQVLKEHGQVLALRRFSNNQAIVVSGGHAEIQTSGERG